ncbi:hypothetical protein NE865_09144 [Phthorimaea operculella]|nr:hypothetical protein NE865_09144 [Phthorimaea operculella]
MPRSWLVWSTGLSPPSSPSPSSPYEGTTNNVQQPEQEVMCNTERPSSHTERTPPQSRDSAHTRGPSHSEIAPRPNRDDVSNTSRHRSVRTVASTASIQARKLAAEAEFQRKQMERERALAKQERERERALADLERAVEEKEFHAQLAAIEANTDKNSVATIKSLRQNQYLHSPELFSSVLNKLNVLLKSRWCDYAKERHQIFIEQNNSKLELLSQFLLSEADTQIKFCAELDAVPPAYHSQTHQHAPAHKTFRAIGGLGFRPATAKRENVNLTSERNQTCLYCKEAHNLKSCGQFKALSVDDRWRWLREAKVCYVCFKNKSHKWNECRGRGSCGVQGCRLRHHPLLHRPYEGTTNNVQQPEQEVMCNTETPGASAPPPPTQPSTSEGTHGDTIKIAAASDISNKNVSALQERTLLKIVPVVVSGPAGEYATHAFLDDGSTDTLIDDTVAARIGATGPLQPLSIAGIGGMTRNTVANIVDFYIKGRNSKERYLIKNAKRMKSLNLSTQSLYERELRAFPHLSDLVNELTHVNVTPTILIGSKDWYLTLSREIREGKRSDPVAVRTLLGWTLHGAVSSQSKPVEFVNHLTWNVPEPIRYASFSTPDPIHSKLDDLTSMMKEQYKLDAIGITERAPRLSKDEERAIEILESTARRLPSGRFEVGLPWRDIDKSKLPDSYPHALARFLSLEKQMAKNKEFASAYREFISGIIKKGYAEECPSDTYHHVPDVGVASRLASEIVQVHGACGFEMRAWISNDVRALSQVPKELWAEAADDVDLPPNKDELDDSDLIRRCDWRRTLRLADAFWTRWMREYLPTLIPRPSSRGTKSRNLSVGDVVLVVDDSLPRGTWPLGKISKIHPGQDGVVRVVDVATQGGTLRRPARKVVLLTQGPQPAADAH